MREPFRKHQVFTRFLGLCTAAGYLFVSCFAGLFHTCEREAVPGGKTHLSCRADDCRPLRRTPFFPGWTLTEASAGRPVLGGPCPACLFLGANHAPQVGLQSPLFLPRPAVAVVIGAETLHFPAVGSAALRIRAPPPFTS